MRFALVILWLFSAVSISAHQNSTAYLFLEDHGPTLQGRWEIPVNDIELGVGLDRNQDGNITWGEVRESLPAIRDYALPRLTLRDDKGSVPLTFLDLLVNQRPSGVTLVLVWQASLTNPGPIRLQYDFGFDYDGGHQCILALQDRTLVLTQDRRTFDFRDGPVEHQDFSDFLRVGVWHIFEGIDHICFLLALMLPSVLRRTGQGWVSVGSFRAAFLSIAKIVTAFTLAHSITLAMAALRIVVLPSALVESVIALSVIVAALNNLWPLWTERSWAVAFGFGLVHGFGFASALADIPSGAASLAVSLAGFNLGVEFGQLCIVLAFLPLAFLLRESWFYRWCAVRAGSVGIACVAAIWLVERAFRVAIF